MLRNESNSELLEGIRRLVIEERQITRHILERIHEVDKRELYLDQGYVSLLDWVIRDLGYSHSAAYRRVQAARQLGAVPEIAAKIDSGALNLTTLSALQTAVHKEEKRTQAPLTLAQRSHLLDRIAEKSTTQAKRAIAEEFPDQVIRRERMGANSSDQIRLTTYFSHTEHDDLQKARAITHPSPGSVPWSSVIVSWARFILKEDREENQRAAPDTTTQSAVAGEMKLNNMELRVAAEEIMSWRTTLSAAAEISADEPALPNSSPRVAASKTNIFMRANERREMTSVHKSSQRSGSVNESSFKPQSKADLYRAVRERDNNSCTYQDPFTGRICGSTYQIQIDHRRPKALGGLDTFENLRLLCRNHSAMMDRRLRETEDGSDETSSKSNDPLVTE